MSTTPPPPESTPTPDEPPDDVAGQPVTSAERWSGRGGYVLGVVAGSWVLVQAIPVVLASRPTPAERLGGALVTVMLIVLVTIAETVGLALVRQLETSGGGGRRWRHFTVEGLRMTAYCLAILVVASLFQSVGLLGYRTPVSAGNFVALLVFGRVVQGALAVLVGVALQAELRRIAA